MSDNGFHAYRKYLSGETAALEVFLQEYSDPLIRFIYCYVHDSATAEEIMEDTVVTLIMKKLHFSDASKLHGYLYKTARNKAIDYIRKHRRSIPLEDVENVLTCGDLETDQFRRARNEHLYRCLLTLPSDYRELLHLTYFEGFSLQEVATILRKNMKQIYNLHTRAKSALKDKLIKEGIGYEDL